MYSLEERDTMRAIQKIAKKMTEKPVIDWEKRRYEIAKEVYVRRVSQFHGYGSIRLRGEAENAFECANVFVNSMKSHEARKADHHEEA